MTDWVPDLEPILGPRYLAFVHALDADITAGHVKPGMRLLPQRDMAQRLGLSVGTVSKAYTEAEQRGLISGEVGRGTFVQRRRADQRIALGTSDATVNLALNVPPYTGEDDLIAPTICEIAAAGEMSNPARLSAASGLAPASRGHGELARFARRDGRPRADLHHPWRPACAVDHSRHDRQTRRHRPHRELHLFRHARAVGAEPIACRASRPMPRAWCPKASTSHSPKPARASSIACRRCRRRPAPSCRRHGDRPSPMIVRKHDAYLVEDDAYAYLLTPPPPPVSALIPDAVSM